MKNTLSQLRILIREEIRSIISESGSYLGKKNDSVTMSGDELSPELINKLFGMIQTSYAKVGGNAKIKTPADVTGEYEKFLMADVDDDPEPDLFIGYNTKNGKPKLGVTGTDGETNSKVALLALQQQFFNNDGYAEVSDAPAHIAINKLNIPYCSDEDKVRKLLGKQITWHGEHPDDPTGRWKGINGWYSRDIGGHSHTKIIVGSV